MQYVAHSSSRLAHAVASSRACIRSIDRCGISCSGGRQAQGGCERHTSREGCRVVGDLLEQAHDHHDHHDRDRAAGGRHHVGHSAAGHPCGDGPRAAVRASEPEHTARSRIDEGHRIVDKYVSTRTFESMIMAHISVSHDAHRFVLALALAHSPSSEDAVSKAPGHIDDDVAALQALLTNLKVPLACWIGRLHSIE